MNIGFVGLGYVGGATNEVLIDFYNVFTYDINKESNCNSIDELVGASDLIFVCVPTPMTKSGQCDLSIVNDVIYNIEDCSDTEKIIILKSTSIPETTKNFESNLEKCKIVFNPEIFNRKKFY